MRELEKDITLLIWFESIYWDEGGVRYWTQFLDEEIEKAQHGKNMNRDCQYEYMAEIYGNLLRYKNEMEAQLHVISSYSQENCTQLEYAIASRLEEVLPELRENVEKASSMKGNWDFNMETHEPYKNE
jgi:hypothetical protein